MPIILYPTKAGMDRENLALANGTAMPKISKLVVGDGTPLADPTLATELVHPCAESVQTAVVRLSQTAMEIRAGLDKSGSYTIKEIGIELADGTLYAYGAMMAPDGFFKGDGIAIELPCVLSRENMGQVQVEWNILDINSLAENIKNLALDEFAGEASPLVTGMVRPLEQAVRLTWQDGGQRFEMELFGERFTLIDSPDLQITGARAGDDSIDLAGQNGSLLAGDYMLFDGANAEQVRLSENLELGRRVLAWNLAHTYPAAATISRTNWAINPGMAVCPAGGVYFPRKLQLVDGDIHRVYITALTGHDAPTLSWRTEGGEFIESPISDQTVRDSLFSDYMYEVPAGEYFYLRIVTPTATQVRSIVACNSLSFVRVVTPPVVIGDTARPGEPVALAFSADSRLIEGGISHFDVVSSGVLSHHPAINGRVVANVTLQGSVGDYHKLVVTAVDDLGNRSVSVIHRIELRDTAPSSINAPTVIMPTSGQTEISEQPTLQSSAFATTGGADTHASSQWQIRTVAGTWETPLHDSGATTTNKTSYTIPSGVLFAGQSQYVMRVRHTGTIMGASAWSSDISFTTKQKFAQIIGIVCTATGGGAGAWQCIDENFNGIVTNTATFSNHPTYSGIIDQIIDSQSMIKVPKYFLRTGSVPSGIYAGKRYWLISDQPVAGFDVHPAFMNAGTQIDQFWVGKYQGTTDGTKLGSVAGLTPLVSIDFPTMQTRAANRNTGGVTGFGLWNIYQLSAIQTLALIEMGGSDSQTLVGQGNVSGGGLLPVDNATVAQATWRGIVGLWGNVWQMVDGLQTDASSKYMIWDKNGNKTYKTTSLTAPAGNYPITMATATGTDYDLATVFAAETTNATAGNGTYGDYFYQSPSCVAYHGGNWGVGAHAGLFYLSVSDAASNSYPYIGGRLAKV